MNAQVKTDFEKWIISQATKEGSRYYILVGTVKAYLNFEGMQIGNTDNEVSIMLVPFGTDRVASGTKVTSGQIRFFCYSKTQLGADKIVDALAAKLDEVTINVTGSFRIELGVLSMMQRNKFQDSLYFEDVANIDFWHWSQI